MGEYEKSRRRERRHKNIESLRNRKRLNKKNKS